MSVETSLSSDGHELTIKVGGRFDFSAHQAFRDAYESQNLLVTSYIIDLRETSYLDSSALGMLLLLRDHAGGDKSQVGIINCNPDVRKILKISSFEQLFRIQ